MSNDCLYCATITFFKGLCLAMEVWNSIITLQLSIVISICDTCSISERDTNAARADPPIACAKGNTNKSKNNARDTKQTKRRSKHKTNQTCVKINRSITARK